MGLDTTRCVVLNAIWENVVTCCNSCNNKKAYHLLEDINMTLLKIPTAPTIFELWTRQQKRFQQH